MNALQTVLEPLRGATFVTLEAHTTPDWRTKKLPEMLFGVKKYSLLNGCINWIYQHSVNNQRMREGLEPDFIPIPRTWGTRLFPSPLVEYKGKYYLEVKRERILLEEYFDENGNIVDYERVKPYLRDKKESSRQQVKKKIVLRDFNLENIIQLTINGVIYQ